MADASYNTAVYMEQGGSKLVVASAGQIQNEGTITNSGAGLIAESVEVQTLGSAAATPLLPYGISIVGSSTGATTYALPAPTAAGVTKIICGSSGVASSTATNAVVSTTAAGTTLIAHSFDLINIEKPAGGVQLIGIPSSTGGAPLLTWGIVSQSSTGVTIIIAP